MDRDGRQVQVSQSPLMTRFFTLVLVLVFLSTLDKAYTALLSSYENTASDHDSFASALSADVADPLKVLERFKDESRRKQMAFFAKLVAERDRIYGERLKAKQKVCWVRFGT